MLASSRGRVVGRQLARALSTTGVPNSSPDACDAVVIGSGVIGCATALGLARRGFNVRVVDKLPDAGLGTTSYSSGILRSFYSALGSVQFAWEGYQYFVEWEDFLGHDGGERGLARLRECGGMIPIVNGREAETFRERVTAHFDALGVPYERLDAAGLKRKLPCVDLACYGPPKRICDEAFGVPSGETIQGAIYAPRTGYISDPGLATYNLRVAAEQTGRASFTYGESVEEIELSPSGGRVAGVRLGSGTRLSAPVVINAAGAQSSKVTALAFGASGGGLPGGGPANDMTLTTRPLRVEVAYVNGPDDFDYGELGTVWTDFDTGAYWRPEVGGKILIGSIEPACDELEWVDDCDATPAQGGVNPSLTDNWTNYVYRCALRIPGVQVPSSSNTQGIVAMYDATEDWIPMYDRSAIDGFYVAIGTSGNQFKNAGVVSTLMGALVEYCENGNDHDTRPLQLDLERTGQTLSTDMFSRLRGFSAATSGSVLG